MLNTSHLGNIFKDIPNNNFGLGCKECDGKFSKYISVNILVPANGPPKRTRVPLVYVFTFKLNQYEIN